MLSNRGRLPSRRSETDAALGQGVRQPKTYIVLVRRFALYALAAVFLGATGRGVPWFTPARAMSALVRDDFTVQACMPQHDKGIREALTVQALASNPRLALVQVQESCVCGAQNCPFWVYRVDGGAAKQILADYVISIQTVARRSGPPDIVTLAHDSALVSDGTRYAFANGSYVAVNSWRVRGDTGATKPESVEIKFAPGTSSARLSGSVSTGWNDVYTFAASAGQRLTISAATPPKGLDIELYAESNGPQPRRVAPDRKAVVLPVTGKYRMSVDAIGTDMANVRYALTLTIR